uniref:Inner membrane protein n=1 Tax=Heterorhabditis bacteriophora TaxID=37862 RepID=A0A1I7X6S6_HETBA
MLDFTQWKIHARRFRKVGVIKRVSAQARLMVMFWPGQSVAYILSRRVFQWKAWSFVFASRSLVASSTP